MALVDQFEASACQFATKTAVVDAGGRLTYAQLAVEVTRL